MKRLISIILVVLMATALLAVPALAEEPPRVGFNTFNNGNDTQNPNMAGTIRIWTQINGANAAIPIRWDGIQSPRGSQDVTVADQNGNNAMRFVTINFVGNRPQDGMVNYIDVRKPADCSWQTINMTVTTLDQTVSLLLTNNRYVACTPDNATKVVTEATCSSNGKIEEICNVCSSILSVEDIAKLEHDFVSIVWDGIGWYASECEFCDWEGYISDDACLYGCVCKVDVVSAAGAKFISIVETAKNSRVWVLKFSVNVGFSDGSSETIVYSINLNGNNANQDGRFTFGAEHDLEGYTLTYDIKGNGSNIKTFVIK